MALRKWLASPGGLATRGDGSIISLPNMAMLGVRPVTLWTVIRYADMTVSSHFGQLPGFSSAVQCNICKRVLLIRSVWPLHCGWNGVVRVFEMPVRSQSSLKSLPSKFLLWSECNLQGRPNIKRKPSYKTRMHVDASASGSGNEDAYFCEIVGDY